MCAKFERFEMRLEETMLDRLDAWRESQADGPSRAESIRRLIDQGLASTEQKPIRLSDGEKLIITMLADIKRGKDGNEINPDFVLDAVFGGHLWGLRWQYSGLFHNHTDSDATVSEVVSILDMWSILRFSFAKLPKEEQDRVRSASSISMAEIHFPGFDGNYESEHLSVALFMIEKLQRFTEFKARDLNSHHPTLDRYRHMLSLFEPSRKTLGSSFLSAPQIIELLNA